MEEAEEEVEARAVELEAELEEAEEVHLGWVFCCHTGATKKRL